MSDSANLTTKERPKSRRTQTEAAERGAEAFDGKVSHTDCNDVDRTGQPETEPGPPLHGGASTEAAGTASPARLLLETQLQLYSASLETAI